MAFKMSSFAETMALGYLKSQVVKIEFVCVDGIKFLSKDEKTMGLGNLKSQVVTMELTCWDNGIDLCLDN